VFKLAEKRKVKWPVTMRVPQDGGAVAKHTVGVEFEVLKKSEQQSVIDSGGDLLEIQVVGWDHRMKDESGADLPYSPEAKAHLLELTWARQCLLEAIGEINSGREAARKN
jgi:hypothetical protein